MHTSCCSRVQFNSIHGGCYPLELLAEHVRRHLRSVEGFQSDSAGVVLVVSGKKRVNTQAGGELVGVAGNFSSLPDVVAVVLKANIEPTTTTYAPSTLGGPNTPPWTLDSVAKKP